MKIFIHKQGQTLGPYSVEEVQSRIARSELSPADLAWQEGTRDWQPLTSLIGMGRSNAGLPPPIPPAPVRYAGFWRRVVAVFIDWLALLVPVFAVGFVLGVAVYQQGKQ